MNVLVITDLSEASLASIESIGSCGPTGFGNITLLHVIDLDPVTAGSTIPQLAEWASAELERVAETLRDRWFTVETRVDQGPVLARIEAVADEIDAGLIAMTNVGKGALPGRLLGSTAEKLAAGARRMVLVERVRNREDQWCRLGEGSPFQTIVAGVDDVTTAGRFLEVLGGLPGLQKLVLVNVAGSDADARVGREALATIAAQATPPLVEVETIVTEGDAADRLLRQARAADATAIAVAPIARGVLRRGMLGSVSHEVLSKADRAVLLVPWED